MPQIAVASEDELSESICVKLVTEIIPDANVALKFRKGGFGYLKSNIPKFYDLAMRVPIVLLTDLDRHKCAVTLRSDWFAKKPLPEKFVFRVAVTEVEAWLLADHAGMRRLIRQPQAKIAAQTDQISDPKRELLRLAERAPRDIRSDLIATHDQTQGLGYNARLSDFVQNVWSTEAAARRSHSLSRALQSIRNLKTLL